MSAIVEIIKNVLIWLIILILLPIPLFCLVIYKAVITIIGKLKYSKLNSFDVSDTMAIGDSVYTKPILNVGMIIKVAGNISLAELRELFKTKLLDPIETGSTTKPLHQNLYCYIQRFGGYHFKRFVTQINLEDHITESELDTESENLDGNIDEEALLNKFIWKFYYSPHTYGKPLWDICVVNNKSNNSCIIFFRIHHSMADGLSIIHLFNQLTENVTPNLSMPFNETLCDKIKLIASGPRIFSSYMSSVTSYPNPFPKNSGTDPKFNYSLITLDLAKVKNIRHQAGDNGGPVHVLPILLTLLGSVFRRLFLEKGIFTSEEELPVRIYLGSSLPWPNHPRNKMCNEWTVGFFKVPIKNPNALERLLETEKDHNQFFNVGINKIVKRSMVPLMSLFPICMFDKMSQGELPMSASWAPIVAGNDYKLLGKSIDHIFPIVGHTHPKLTWVTISLSHSNKIDVTIAVNQEFIKETKDLNQITNKMINEELDKLSDLVATSNKKVD